MEEADILGDKTAIMAKGRIRAIGTNQYLKQQFASGYVLSLSIATNSEYNYTKKDVMRVERVKKYMFDNL